MKPIKKSIKQSLEEKEDIALGYAIRQGIKSGYVAEGKVMKVLRKRQSK